MIPSSKLSSKQRLILLAIVLAILAGTLWPTSSHSLRSFSFCLTCDFRWLADGVLNIGLFVPFGFAAGWRARSSWRVVLAGALLSTTIELLQLVIPGRDPSLRDIITNTAGSALGVLLAYRPRTWLTPTARYASWLANGTALVIFAVIASTAVLLEPAQPGEPIEVSRAERDAVVQYQSHGNVIGLDQPAYYVEGVFPDGGSIGASAAMLTRQWSGWCLRVEQTERCGIGPTLGRGWAALMYPSALPHRWADVLIDMAWTAALFFPLGFWTTRRTGALALVIAIVLLGGVPIIVGLVPTPLAEWMSACASIGLGYAAAESVRRHLAPSDT